MKLKEQNINNKEFKWSAKHIMFILEIGIKKHIKRSITYAKWGQ